MTVVHQRVRATCSVCGYEADWDGPGYDESTYEWTEADQAELEADASNFVCGDCEAAPLRGREDGGKMNKVFPRGLTDYLQEFDNLLGTEVDSVGEIVRFRGTLDGEEVCGHVTAGGFGQPFCIVQVGNVDLALIESEDYEQEGSDPVECDGWEWRESRDTPELLHARFQGPTGRYGTYASARKALEAAHTNPAPAHRGREETT